MAKMGSLCCMHWFERPDWAEELLEPRYRHQTRNSLHTSRWANDLSRSVTVIEFQEKMPCSKKIADELLLGLFYDPQDLCTYSFTDLDFDFDFELLNDEKFDLGNQDADADADIRPSYMSLIDLNGKRRFSLFLVSRQFWKLTALRRRVWVSCVFGARKWYKSFVGRPWWWWWWW